MIIRWPRCEPAQVLILLGLLLGAAGAVTGMAAEPGIVCKAPIHDFGSMDNRRSVTHTFILENRGTAPLLISGVRACCGASARLSNDTVPPGSNTTLEVTLSLHRRRGRQVKTVYVMSNDPVTPRLRIQLKGLAVVSLDVQPDFLNFGRVQPDSVQVEEFSVFTAGGEEFEITNVLSTVPYFVATVEKAEANAFRLAVETVPPLPGGLTRGTIRVMTDYETNRQVSVNVVAAVYGSLLTIPRELVLAGSADANVPVERCVVVRARDDRAFRVIDTELPDSDMQITVVPLNKSSVKCTVSRMFPTRNLNGKRIVLVTDRQGSERVEIPIRVVGRASPAGESRR